jgi:hypothetical protein
MSDSNSSTQQAQQVGVDSGSVEYMLTTVDNPFDPFTQFDEWLAYDTRLGYNTAGMLARIVNTSDELPEVQQQLDIQAAIDEIVRENVLGLYKKVPRPTTPSQGQA